MILDLLRKRVSVRKFQDKPIPDDVLREILEAGRLSPSGGNEQPWVSGVVTERSLIAQIAEAAYRQTWILGAPLLIVLCITIVTDEQGGRDIQVHRFPEYAGAISGMDKGLYSALDMEEHQTKIAGTHMALTALEHGVGSCWVSRFEVRRVAELLHLPEGVIPAEILVFGYPEKAREPTRKKPMEEVVFCNVFGPGRLSSLTMSHFRQHYNELGKERIFPSLAVIEARLATNSVETVCPDSFFLNSL